MYKDENTCITIRVINSNTGHVVRNEQILTHEKLIVVAKKYSTKDSIVVTSIDNVAYCFYINDEDNVIVIPNTDTIKNALSLFDDVLSGLYDNARDAFHIEMGRVMGLFQFIRDLDESKVDTFFNCIDDIWETRYYSRFLRREK